jgi:copper chaperone
MTQTWTVTGMTCAHCAASVTEEVSELPGVRAVQVALDTGVLTVDAHPRLADAAVRLAVEEAGYRIA